MELETPRRRRSALTAVKAGSAGLHRYGSPPGRDPFEIIMAAKRPDFERESAGERT